MLWHHPAPTYINWQSFRVAIQPQTFNSQCQVNSHCNAFLLKIFRWKHLIQYRMTRYKDHNMTPLRFKAQVKKLATNHLKFLSCNFSSGNWMASSRKYTCKDQNRISYMPPETGINQIPNLKQKICKRKSTSGSKASSNSSKTIWSFWMWTWLHLNLLLQRITKTEL